MFQTPFPLLVKAILEPLDLRKGSQLLALVDDLDEAGD